jgi:hypothetical protein
MIDLGVGLERTRGYDERASFVIDDATVSTIKAPLITPFRIATGQHDEWENVFLRLRTSEGVCGYGEAAVATHITGETVPRNPGQPAGHGGRPEKTYDRCS